YEVPVAGPADHPPAAIRLQEVMVRADPPRVACACIVCPQRPQSDPERAFALPHRIQQGRAGERNTGALARLLRASPSGGLKPRARRAVLWRRRTRGRVVGGVTGNSIRPVD